MVGTEQHLRSRDLVCLSTELELRASNWVAKDVAALVRNSLAYALDPIGWPRSLVPVVISGSVPGAALDLMYSRACRTAAWCGVGEAPAAWAVGMPVVAVRSLVLEKLRWMPRGGPSFSKVCRTGMMSAGCRHPLVSSTWDMVVPRDPWPSSPGWCAWSL